MNKGIIKSGDKLYMILKILSPHSILKDNEINKQLLGMWVKWEDGDHVLEKDGKFLICRTIQDAEILEEIIG